MKFIIIGKGPSYIHKILKDISTVCTEVSPEEGELLVKNHITTVEQLSGAKQVIPLLNSPEVHKKSSLIDDIRQNGRRRKIY